MTPGWLNNTGATLYPGKTADQHPEEIRLGGGGRGVDGARRDRTVPIKKQQAYKSSIQIHRPICQPPRRGRGLWFCLQPRLTTAAAEVNTRDCRKTSGGGGASAREREGERERERSSRQFFSQIWSTDRLEGIAAGRPVQGPIFVGKGSLSGTARLRSDTL